MASVTPKIVLLKEDFIGDTAAAEAVISEVGLKRDQPVDALTVMQTEFEPTVESVCSTPEGGFFTASISEAEAKKLKDNPNVEDVVDDEMQYAIGADDPRGGVLVEDVVDEIDDLVSENLDDAMLEHDDVELAALEAELASESEAAIEEPSPEIQASIEGAAEWLRSVAISGIRVDRIRRPDGRTERVLVEDSDAPPVWARFYELVTDRPLYLDRDSVYRYDFAEIGYERRSGYSYHGDWAASLLSEDYPRWRGQNGR